MSEHCQFASDEIRRLLAMNGLVDLRSAFQLGEPVGGIHEDRANRHAFKNVVNLDLRSPDGAWRLYIKRQWRRERLIPRLTDLRHRIAIQCSPIHEWRGLHILQNAGFDVCEPLAIFWRGWGFSHGAVVTKSLPVCRSLADLIQNGDFESLSSERRDSLVQAAATLIARLHRQRISWRSMKAKHFYPEEIEPCRWRIWLIDCEGVSTHASTGDLVRQWMQFLKYFELRAPLLKARFSTCYCPN